MFIAVPSMYHMYIAVLLSIDASSQSTGRYEVIMNISNSPKCAFYREHNLVGAFVRKPLRKAKI